MTQLTCEFVLKLAPPQRLATRAVSQRVAGLEHELFDDTVEDDAVVVSLSREADKILHCFGNMLREEAEMDVTHRRVQRRRRGDGGAFRDRLCSSKRLLLASRFLIEDVSLGAGFAARITVGGMRLKAHISKSLQINACLDLGLTCLAPRE